MDWLELYRQDLARYTKYRGQAWPFVFATEQGLWALLQYRIASAIYRSNLPGLPKKAIMLVLVFWQKAIEVITGISLPYAATIGAGFYIGHYGNIIINEKAVIGQNCNISQGVTIGVSGRKDKRGVPVIGDRVYIGANAVVAGKIHIGNDVAIAANSLVTTDVPEHATVVGVPAQVINNYGSGYYIDPTDD